MSARWRPIKYEAYLLGLQQIALRCRQRGNVAEAEKYEREIAAALERSKWLVDGDGPFARLRA